MMLFYTRILVHQLIPIHLQEFFMLFYFLLKPPSSKPSSSKPSSSKSPKPEPSQPPASPEAHLEDLNAPVEYDAAALKEQYQQTQSNYGLERRIFW